MLPNLCDLRLHFLTFYVFLYKYLLFYLLSCRMEDELVPRPGEWPVDPQIDVKISKDRIWIDGCFDFAHHGLPAHRLQDWSLPKAY